jgi:hypothetical protein
MAALLTIGEAVKRTGLSSHADSDTGDVDKNMMEERCHNNLKGKQSDVPG